MDSKIPDLRDVPLDEIPSLDVLRTWLQLRPVPVAAFTSSI
jgi:hypothetical protein